MVVVTRGPIHIMALIEDTKTDADQSAHDPSAEIPEACAYPL